MSGLSEAERRVMEAVARSVPAPLAWSDDPPGAVLTVAGRRVALEVAAVARRTPSRAGVPARFRDDRVARRVLAELEASGGPRTPDGRAAIVTLGAPIKVPNRMLPVLTDLLLDRLAGRNADADECLEIHGNRVRFRILGDGAIWTGKVVGFVFTGDPRPGDLAIAMRDLHDAVAAKAGAGPVRRSAEDRWLVLVGDWIADPKAYRKALSRLAVPEGFGKILMVAGGGRIEPLLG